MSESEPICFGSADVVIGSARAENCCHDCPWEPECIRNHNQRRKELEDKDV